LPRCGNACFPNFFIFLFASVLRGGAIVLSGNKDLRSTLISRAAKEPSEGCKEVVFPENLWIYFPLRKTRIQRVFGVLRRPF